MMSCFTAVPFSCLRRALAVSLALVVTVTAQGSLEAVQDPTYASGDPLPLRGRLTGTSQLSPGGQCASVPDHPLVAALELTGTVSHLGRVTWSSVDCTSIAAFPEITFVQGEGVLTAASGDQIHFTYSGSAVANASGVAEFSATATITGGTGRFAGVTGEFEFGGALALATGAVTMQVDGWIQ